MLLLSVCLQLQFEKSAAAANSAKARLRYRGSPGPFDSWRGYSQRVINGINPASGCCRTGPQLVVVSPDNKWDLRGKGIGIINALAAARSGPHRVLESSGTEREGATAGLMVTVWGARAEERVLRRWLR